MRTVLVLFALVLACTGCAVSYSSRQVAPVPTNQTVGIPANAMLVLYGRGTDLMGMPQPSLAPGTIYVYDETAQQITAIMPHRHQGQITVNSLILDLGHYYRVYYMPNPTPPAGM